MAKAAKQLNREIKEALSRWRKGEPALFWAGTGQWIPVKIHDLTASGNPRIIHPVTGKLMVVRATASLEKASPARRPLGGVTAETIMDWQIREVADAAKRSTPTERDLLNETLVALGSAPASASMRERWLRARARSAAAWNARHAAGGDDEPGDV